MAATDKIKGHSVLLGHGARTLAGVHVDSYSAELADRNHFSGDEANSESFVRMVDALRVQLRKMGDDPLGRKPTTRIGRKKSGDFLEGDPDESAVVHSAIEAFAQNLHAVARGFLQLKSWRDTQSIVIGGGFRATQVGELAVDIGGSTIRAGIVRLGVARTKDLSHARVAAARRWSHKDEKNVTRDEAVSHLVTMLSSLLKEAEADSINLAPFAGVGCPGIIRPDGTIARGAGNLPGHWESPSFNLPQIVREQIARRTRQELMVLMHNDAVLQGLSELPRMRGRRHWGIFTIGTGLGNARFTTSPISQPAAR